MKPGFVCNVGMDIYVHVCLYASFVRVSVLMCICYQQCPSVLAEGQSI